MNERKALLVACTAYIIGGLGNVAFSMHDGNVTGLTLVRFPAGILVALLLGKTLRATNQQPNESRRRGRIALHVAGASEAAAIALLMKASETTTTFLLTVAGMLVPAIVAAASPLIGVPRPRGRRAVLAALAVVTATAAVLLGSESEATVDSGALLVGLGVLGSAVSVLASKTAGQTHPPQRILLVLCGWGTAGAMLAGVLWTAPVVTSSTVVVGLFIALLPGGAAKLMLYWSTARTSPTLVSAAVAAAPFSAGIGGWLLLNETPRATQVALGAIAVILSALMGASREQRLPDAYARRL